MPLINLFDAGQLAHLFRFDVARDLRQENLRIMLLTVRYALIVKNPGTEFGRPGRGFCFIRLRRNTLQLAAGMKGKVNRAEAHQSEGGLIRLQAMVV